MAPSARNLDAAAINTARREVAQLRAARWTDARIASRLTDLAIGAAPWTAADVVRFMEATRDHGPGFIATAAPDASAPPPRPRIET
jgi:hypothetical protein